MTDKKYATGGIVRSGAELPAFLFWGCDYIIPHALAKKWREELDRLNNDVLD